MRVLEKHNRQGIQGDVCFTRVDKIPEHLIPATITDNQLVVAHSESGHNHSFDGDSDVELLENPENPLEAYLHVKTASEIKHHKPVDAHETVRFTEGYYRINRQRENTPKGWRRVVD